MVVLCPWRVADTWRPSVRILVLIQYPVLPIDPYSRMVEYVFLKDPSIHPCFIKIYIGANLDQGSSNKNLTFTRRYLDPNRVTYEASFFICESRERL